MDLTSCTASLAACVDQPVRTHKKKVASVLDVVKFSPVIAIVPRVHKVVVLRAVYVGEY